MYKVSRSICQVIEHRNQRQPVEEQRALFVLNRNGYGREKCASQDIHHKEKVFVIRVFNI